MQIFVTLLDGSTVTVETAAGTVDDVKRQIEELEGVPVDLQRLAFQGCELAAGSALVTNGVRNGATLHLTMNLAGAAIAMLIFVTSLDGSSLTVEAVEGTVDAVKRQIEELEGVPVEFQILAFEGRELVASRALASYDVRDGATLHPTMNLNGGYGYVHQYERYLASKHLLYKNICRKCYGRLSPHATRCHKVKCGRTSDIRPKKFFYDRNIKTRHMLDKPYNSKYFW